MRLMPPISFVISFVKTERNLGSGKHAKSNANAFFYVLLLPDHVPHCKASVHHHGTGSTVNLALKPTR